MNRIRTKKFIVWIVITPIILMVFLNMIGAEEEVEIDIAVIDKDESNASNITMSFLKSEDRVKVHEIDELEHGIDMMRDGKVEAVLEIPDDFSEKLEIIRSEEELEDSLVFRLYHVSGDGEELLETILKGITAEINEFLIGEEAKGPVSIEARSRDIREGDYVDLLISSGVMITLLQSGLFSSSSTTSSLSEQMIEKMIKMSPSPQIFSVGGMITTDSLFTFFSGLIALVAGLIIFGANPSIINILAILPISLLTALVFCFFGAGIGRITSDRIASQGLTSMTILPLIFLSKAHLYPWLFPQYITDGVRFFPIYPGLNMINRLLFYSPTLSEYLVAIGVNLLWLGVFLTIFWYLYRR